MRSRGNQIRPNQWNKYASSYSSASFVDLEEAVVSSSNMVSSTNRGAVGSNVDGIQLSDAATLNKLVGILHVGRFWKRKLRDFRRVLVQSLKENIFVVKKDSHGSSAVSANREKVATHVQQEFIEADVCRVDKGCEPFIFSAKATNKVALDPDPMALYHEGELVKLEATRGSKRGRWKRLAREGMGKRDGVDFQDSGFNEKKK
ncbi:hypothetical protein ACOSQ3_028769 [Xanthoceras sorbifolium]